ncbi:MAG: class I SAM-dependent methyltransferase [Desulfobacterales bacterium]|jgi:hypothetical protein
MNLPVWLWIVFSLWLGLFAAKAAYGFGVAVALPKTRGALFVSSSKRRISIALSAIHPSKDGLLVDLGCGDGRILRHARKHYGIRAVGYEVNPIAWAKAKCLTAFDNGISIRFQDFRRADLSTADIVAFYLFPDVLGDLSQDLQKGRFKTGAVLVSFNFPLPGTRPSFVVHPPGSLHSDPVFFYRVS